METREKYTTKNLGGRPPLEGKVKVLSIFTQDLIEQIDSVLQPGESRSLFLRKAAAAEIQKRQE